MSKLAFGCALVLTLPAVAADRAKSTPAKAEGYQACCGRDPGRRISTRRAHDRPLEHALALRSRTRYKQETGTR